MRSVFAAVVASILLMGTTVTRAAEQHCTECGGQAHAGHGHCQHCQHGHHHGTFDRAKARMRHAYYRGKEKYRDTRDRFISDYHQAHLWPDPYRCQARHSALAPFEIQMANAWSNMTTLNTLFFDPDTHKLTNAGRLHVRWVLLQAPVSRRSLSVQKGAVADITEARLASVREVVAEIAGADYQIAIAVSDRIPYLAPGIDVDVSSILYYSSFPLPRLPGTTTEETGATAPAGLPGQ